MAVFVDGLRYYERSPMPYGQRGPWWWCHLFADTTAELHAFAEKIGLRMLWFQDKRYPHYDLTPSRKRQALAAGAEQITTRDWIRRCRSAKR